MIPDGPFSGAPDLLDVAMRTAFLPQAQLVQCQTCRRPPVFSFLGLYSTSQRAGPGPLAHYHCSPTLPGGRGAPGSLPLHQPHPPALPLGSDLTADQTWEETRVLLLTGCSCLGRSRSPSELCLPIQKVGGSIALRAKASSAMCSK